MKERELAKIYGKAIFETGKAQGIAISKEMTIFTELINSSNDLENVLFLDVFDGEAKKEIVSEFVKKLNLSSFFKNIVFFLIDEKRISLLPLIYKEIIVIEDHEKGFLRGTIEGTAAELPADVLNRVKSFISNELKINSELTYVVNDKITSGYKVVVEDYLIDASVNNQLDKIKNLFAN